MNSIVIRNCNCLDPQHGIVYEPRDLFVVNGFFKSSNAISGSIDQELDAANRIVFPGGIFPSLRTPAPTTGYVKSQPRDFAKILIKNGFTTVIVDGISPFVSLDVHRYLQHLPGLNKVPFIEAGNFQLLTGFLKNGVANYAVALENELLDQFKGYGISCMNPGTAVRWRNDMLPPQSIFEPLPFLAMSCEKIISELVAAHSQGIIKAALIVETGIEGLSGSTDDFITFLAAAWNRLPEERKDHVAPTLAFKQLSRASCDPDLTPSEIEETVQKLQVAIQEHPGIAGFLDIPIITSEDAMFIDNSNSILQDPDNIIARGIIEGEMFQSIYRVASDQKREILGKYWLAGTKYLLDLPAELHDTIAFSVMPHVIRECQDIATIVGSLLSEASRNAVMARANGKYLPDISRDLIGDKVISLPDFMHFSRVVPARILGLEKYIGGLADDQVGDVIILNAEESDLDSIMNDPSRLQDMLSDPFAVIKGGDLIYKNHEFNCQDKGFTFLQGLQEQSSITGSIKENLDKQFLKYYSTHENSKVVPESMIEPVLIS